MTSKLYNCSLYSNHTLLLVAFLIHGITTVFLLLAVVLHDE